MNTTLAMVLWIENKDHIKDWELVDDKYKEEIITTIGFVKSENDDFIILTLDCGCEKHKLQYERVIYKNQCLDIYEIDSEKLEEKLFGKHSCNVNDGKWTDSIHMFML